MKETAVKTKVTMGTKIVDNVEAASFAAKVGKKWQPLLLLLVSPRLVHYPGRSNLLIRQAVLLLKSR